MQTILNTLQWAKQELAGSSDSAELDAEILLAHMLKVSRSYLRAFSEQQLSPALLQIYTGLIQKRQQGIPIAYLLGKKEFWSLELMVSEDTLIPRPETEQLVEIVLNTLSTPKKMIADLGTGSGAIALALAHERPMWDIHATDCSVNALEIAKRNSQRLGLSNIHFYQGNWCAALPPMKFDAIISNPPYIALNDPHLQKSVLQYEPRSALISEENGLQDIRIIIAQAQAFLKPNGLLMLEHGAEQGEAVRQIFMKYRYSPIQTYLDFAGHERVTCAFYC